MFHVEHLGGIYLRTNIFKKLIDIFFAFLIAYILLFVLCEYLTPDLGEVKISVTTNKEKNELQKITLSASKAYNNFYFLLYEDSNEPNWIYTTSKMTSKPKKNFMTEYLPSSHTRYVYFEGNKNKNLFTVDIKPKYSIGHMSSKDHVFHLVYIVPYKLLFFPQFYYAKHFTFFVDPIMS